MATAADAAVAVSPSNTRVGWIGTGVMGRSMCSHLIKAGYSLTVFTRTASKAQPLVELGAKLADSPIAVASQSDVVFSIVGYPSDVRQVLLEPTTGALHGLRPGGVLVDMTTSEPSLAAEIAAAAAAKHCYSIRAQRGALSQRDIDRSCWIEVAGFVRWQDNEEGFRTWVLCQPFR
ncbi:unnamed protein product [Linum tenue]|uniref:6-phosphogluconate dehydrogenase NADP-binding domain-containing protein n=1 Tax=Linum tenue TaxID=586396 RepID=A0AAV0SA03_9ROSI|nr:unnamed protein product [Linum tenue]